jgi:hypothetical protein
MIPPGRAVDLAPFALAGVCRMASLISGIKALARRLGAEVTRSGLATRADLRLQHLLNRLQPDEVLYDGQADWRALDALLVARGFVLWDTAAFFRSPTNGRLENANFFYVRKEWLAQCK